MKRNSIILFSLILVLFAGKGYTQVQEPVVSMPGGFYSSGVEVEITAPDSGAVIYYTLDGRDPDTSSILYTGPVKIDSTTALAMRAFMPDSIPSRVFVQTYIINFQTDLPVFSLVTNPDHFFSDTSGIYVEGTNGTMGFCAKEPRNWNQDWIRPINIEFFESDKSPAFNVKSGVKIYGGCTRLYPMKSLGFFFKEEYGYKKLNYKLFPDVNVNKFNNFILRSAGQDWWRLMFRDAMVHTLARQNMNIDALAYRPTIVFINGAFWGIHNLREKPNEHYIENHYGGEADSVDMIQPWGPAANAGNLDAFYVFRDFYNTKDLSIKENYETIKEMLDIDEYIDYNIVEIFAANGDWPGNNTKMWRHRGEGNKWRMQLFDTDFGFGGNAKGQYDTNNLEMATAENGTGVSNPKATILLRKLLKNTDFRNEFIQRFAVHMNTTFEKEHLLHVMDSISSRIAPEIPRHKERWEKSISFATWEKGLQIVKDFINLRHTYMRRHIYSKFGVPGAYSLVISRNDPAMGKITAHTVELKKNGAMHIFFEEVPLKLKAVPMPGFRFVKWEGIINSESPEIEINTTENSAITAVFEPAEVQSGSIVINEINYKSSDNFDTEDWIEIYNSSADTTDISGWILQDDNPDNAFTFPAGTKIGGHGYLVISRDTAKFNPLVTGINVTGDMDFGLSSSGDMVVLTDAAGLTVDSVQFGVSGEWPAEPNGTGATLSLINPDLDNLLPASWKASALYGTPGRLNDVYTGVEDENLVYGYELFDNYPNPFNPVTKIKYSIKEPRHVRLAVYDVLGNEVSVLADRYMGAGVYETEFDASNLSSGIYFYHLNAGAFQQVKKMMLLK